MRAKTVGEPLRIALVEQRHFSSGTSGKNSQLIHGGLRYLKNLEIGLVKEALHERAVLTHIAPHLVEPQKFMIPFFGWTSRLYYGTGLWLYDVLAGSTNVGRRSFLTKADVGRIEPGFLREGLSSAAVYYDCRVHSARLVLENIFDAARDGVVIANYARVDGYSKPGSQYRVQITDALSGATFETTARKLVDTTGPWQQGGDLRLVRGSHIVLPRLNASDHAVAYFAEDGRIIFVIPWGGMQPVSLVGTTDCDHAEGPNEVRICPDEIRYLLRIVERLFPEAKGIRPLASFSSLRPLLQSGSESATKTSREHRIWNGSDGVLRIAGGKYTTYRAMSQQAADMVATEVAPRLADICSTDKTPVGGNSREKLSELWSASDPLARTHGLDRREAEWLTHDFGMLSPAVLDDLPETAPLGMSRLESAVAVFAVEHEMAHRLCDLMYVSTYWGFERLWTKDTLRPFACVMARKLRWTEERIDQEIQLALQISAVPAEA